MSPRIDAHQHVWKLARGDYGWLRPDMTALYRDFGFAELAPHLDEAGLEGTVLVQAAPTVAETEFLLEVASDEPRVRAVVGWVDFATPDAPAVLGRLAEHPKLCGVRPMIQDIEDPDWMLRDELAPAFEAVAGLGLAFDALVLPRHLTNLRALCERHPDLRVVIDHAAKPDIASWGADPDARAGWALDMERLAKETPCWCKLSGLVTEAGADWRAADLAPFVEHLFELFGPARLLYGSDWPVVNLAGGYRAWWSAVGELTHHLTPTERNAVFGGNAHRAYGWPES